MEDLTSQSTFNITTAVIVGSLGSYPPEGSISALSKIRCLHSEYLGIRGDRSNWSFRLKDGKESAGCCLSWHAIYDMRASIISLHTGSTVTFDLGEDLLRVLCDLEDFDDLWEIPEYADSASETEEEALVGRRRPVRLLPRDEPEAGLMLPDGINIFILSTPWTDVMSSIRERPSKPSSSSPMLVSPCSLLTLSFSFLNEEPDIGLPPLDAIRRLIFSSPWTALVSSNM